MLAFGALAVPLVNLTTARKVVAVETVIHEAATHKALLRIRFAHSPKSLTLKQGGKEFLPSPDLASSPVEARADFEIPAEGIEFILSAEWPDGTPDTALTLEIEPDGLDTKAETRWSLGSTMTEVISFRWK